MHITSIFFKACKTCLYCLHFVKAVKALVCKILDKIRTLFLHFTRNIMNDMTCLFCTIELQIQFRQLQKSFFVSSNTISFGNYTVNVCMYKQPSSTNCV